MLGALAGLGVVFAVAILAIASTALRRFGDLLGHADKIRSHLGTLSASPEVAFSLRLRDVEDLVDRLPKKWEDIKREASASESRARAHIKRAHKELEERGFTDPGVEQMANELRLVDGEGSPEEGVQQLPLNMEEEAEASPLEAMTWQERTRLKKYGR